MPISPTSSVPVREHRFDSHGVGAVVVADGDQIGEREVGQRIGELVEIHLDAHIARIRRPPTVGRTDVHKPAFVHRAHDRRALSTVVVGQPGECAAMDDIPFLGSEALRRGTITRNDLRTRYRLMFRDAYIGRVVYVTAAIKARAAWLSTGATLAGLSAAAVLGTKWVDAAAPAEIIRADRHSQRGIVVRSYELAEDEVWWSTASA